MSTPTKADQIRAYLERRKRSLERSLAHVAPFNIKKLNEDEFLEVVALLADLDGGGEVVQIKGWVRPAGVDVHGPGYELGSGCGWCEFNEVGQPEHGDQRATLIIHPSPTAADAPPVAERSKPQPSVDEVMDCMDNYFGDARFDVPWDILHRGEGKDILRDRLTKLFNP